jgi:lipopolysaccharide export system protein LptC
MAWTIDWRQLRLGQRMQAWLPVWLLGALALFSYWLVQNSPVLNATDTQRPDSIKPNAYFYNLRLIGYGRDGKWEMQMNGQRASHREDLQHYDIEAPKMLKRSPESGVLTQVSAQRGQINESGTVVHLFGQAVIYRPKQKAIDGTVSKSLEVRSEYLLLDDERHALQTDRPVVIKQDQDQFSAEHMLALQQDEKLTLEGRVRGTLMPRANTPVRRDQ